jgi:hypothetical protein
MSGRYRTTGSRDRPEPDPAPLRIECGAAPLGSFLARFPHPPLGGKHPLA